MDKNQYEHFKNTLKLLNESGVNSSNYLAYNLKTGIDDAYSELGRSLMAFHIAQAKFEEEYYKYHSYVRYLKYSTNLFNRICKKFKVKSLKTPRAQKYWDERDKKGKYKVAKIDFGNLDRRVVIGYLKKLISHDISMEDCNSIYKTIMILEDELGTNNE